MSNSLFNNPITTAFYQGKPSPFANMYFYQTMTLTPISVYNAAGSALTNPVPADLYGQFPQVFIPDTVTDYRVRITTQSGILIADVDPNDNFEATLSSAISAVYTTLAGSDGSNHVGYIQSGAGAVARTLQDLGRERLYLEDFGAKGDGTTSDSSAISAGWSAAHSKKTATYSTPGHIYKMGAGITFTGNNTYLVGDSEGVVQNTALPSVTYRGYGSGAQFTVNGTSDGFKGFALENYGTHSCGIKFGSGGHHLIDSVGIIKNGGNRYSSAAFFTGANSLGYSRFSNIAADGDATPVVFLSDTSAGGDPQSPNNPIVLEYCREFSAYTNPLTVFKFDGVAAESVTVRHSTFNQYNANLKMFDSDNTDGCVNYAFNRAFDVVSFEGCELDYSTAVSTDRHAVFANIADVRIQRATANYGGAVYAYQIRNSVLTFDGGTHGSATTICEVKDFESAVIIRPGTRFNVTNVQHIHNQSVTLGTNTFTGATTSGAKVLSVTAVTSGRVYPGMVIQGAGIPSGTVIQKQLSGTKGGVGTYQLFKRMTATASGVSLSHASGTYPVNSGIYEVPLLVEGGTNYFYIEPWRLDQGVNAFRIVYDSSLAAANIDIEIATPTDNPNIYPISYRKRGQFIPIEVVNTSGGVMGTITWGSGFKVSASLVKPANNNVMTLTFLTDTAISGSTAADVFRQFGKEVSDVPV